MSEPVLVEVRDHIGHVTINRPDRRNALSPAVVRGLTQAFEAMSRDPEVRVVVLSGAGDQAFCAGGDLGDQQASEGVVGMHHDRGAFVELLLAMHRSTRPIIARVQGQALGGGFGLLLACDLAVASETAMLGTPEVRVGLFPMMIMAVMTRNLGRKKTMELILTGARITAQQAMEMGALNDVVSPEALDARVQELAHKVASFSPAVLRLGRQAFYQTEDMSYEQALRTLQAELTINTLTEDAAEGIMAFFGKREPQWKGR